jgi:hypothetical protein
MTLSQRARLFDAFLTKTMKQRKERWAAATSKGASADLEIERKLFKETVHLVASIRFSESFDPCVGLVEPKDHVYATANSGYLIVKAVQFLLSHVLKRPEYAKNAYLQGPYADRLKGLVQKKKVENTRAAKLLITFAAAQFELFHDDNDLLNLAWPANIAQIGGAEIVPAFKEAEAVSQSRHAVDRASTPNQPAKTTLLDQLTKAVEEQEEEEDDEGLQSDMDAAAEDAEGEGQQVVVVEADDDADEGDSEDADEDTVLSDKLHAFVAEHKKYVAHIMRMRATSKSLKREVRELKGKNRKLEAEAAALRAEAAKPAPAMSTDVALFIHRLAKVGCSDSALKKLHQANMLEPANFIAAAEANALPKEIEKYLVAAYRGLAEDLIADGMLA